MIYFIVLEYHIYVCLCVCIETGVQVSEETRIEHHIMSGSSAQIDISAASKIRILCKRKNQF